MSTETDEKLKEASYKLFDELVKMLVDMRNELVGLKDREECADEDLWRECSDVDHSDFFDNQLPAVNKQIRCITEHMNALDARSAASMTEPR